MVARWDREAEQRSMYAICALALAIHIVLLLIFACLRITLMVGMNVLSASSYALCFYLIKKRRLRACIHTAFVEILAHTVLAVISVGTAPGFQLYFIDCIAVIIFTDYFSVHMDAGPVKGLKLSVVCGLMYILTLICARNYEPIYHLDEEIAFAGTICNSVLMIALLVLFFNLLKRTAISYEQELTRQASYDNLTGLVNRYYLLEYMDKVYAAGDMERYWLAIIDIDDFKKVNDVYGHLCGDFALKSVAGLLEKACADCIVCRWGGEEFMVVGREGDSTALLERIRQSIEAKDFAYGDNAVLKLTVTVGKADYRSGQALNEWFDAADSLLYKGKQQGKNRVMCH